MSAAPLEERISAAYLHDVVEHLASFGSHDLGFRVAGTPEERQATAWIAGEMRSLGLTDVAEEPVPVDAWRFLGAYVESDGKRYECASMGGVPDTGPRGVQGELVFVRRGEIELETLAGRRCRLRRGDVLWLAGLPLRVLRNRGTEPALLVTVSRR